MSDEQALNQADDMTADEKEKEEGTEETATPATPAEGQGSEDSGM